MSSSPTGLRRAASLPAPHTRVLHRHAHADLPIAVGGEGRGDIEPLKEDLDVFFDLPLLDLLHGGVVYYFRGASEKNSRNV